MMSFGGVRVRLVSAVDAARAWVDENRTMLGNTSALAGSTVATSLLGFVFWSAAARLFPTSAVGLSSAGVSAMQLLATFGMVGLGTLMISELPRRVNQRGPLLVAALATSVVASLLLWGCLAILALVTPLGSDDVFALILHPIFAVGIALTAASQVLDQSLIGILRGNLQLWRNTAFAVAKLVLLVALGLWIASADEVHVIGSWVAGLVLSFVLVAGLLAREGTRFRYWPEWRLLGTMRRATFKHHVLNLALVGPRLVLPVLVTMIVSADANAAFYAAWMLVSFGFMIPAHFSTVLHAIGAGDTDGLAERLRFSLRTSLAIGAAGGVVLLVAAPLLLRIFGEFYAEEASPSLRVLVLAIPFMVLKLHLVAVERVRDRVGRMALYMTAGGVLEVVLAATGAMYWGITGLSIGFVLALLVQGVLCTPPLISTLRSSPPPKGRP